MSRGATRAFAARHDLFLTAHLRRGRVPMQKHALTLATVLLGGILTACGSDKTTTQPPVNITYKATLSGANERPNPNTSTATGTWTSVLNPTTIVLTYTLSYTGLSANRTATHIHAQ